MYSNIILILLILTVSSVFAQNIKCTRRTISNGTVKLKKKGTFAHYICKKGFELLGQRYINCVRGKWEAEPPYCIKPGCPRINISNYNGTGIYTHNEAVVYFTCFPGFDIIGKNVIYCDGSKWSSDLPTCVESGKNPATSCDFENGLCGWTASLNHDFDWKRQNFKTPSGHLQTGPSYDHTKGPDKDGYYMYIESVSQEQDDSAMLISPMYNKMSDGFCFRFYYHMYGTGIGVLRVFIRKENESLLKIPVFSKSGNHGDRWIEEIITVDKMDKPFQIIIEGVRGTSIVSDIAIDDVELFEKDNCPLSENSGSTELPDYSTVEGRDFGSCASRCNMKSDGQSCDCYEGCEENNTCCPDYKPLCLYDQTDFTDSTETDLMASTLKWVINNQPTTLNPIDNSSKTAEKTISVLTEKPVVATTQKPAPVVTQKIIPVTTQKIQIVTQKIPNVTQKIPNVTQKIPNVPQKIDVVTQKIPVVTQKIVPVVPQKIVPAVTQKSVVIPTQKVVTQKPVPVVTQKPVPVVPQKPVPVIPQKPVPVVPQKPVSNTTQKSGQNPVTRKILPIPTQKPVVPQKPIPVVPKKTVPTTARPVTKTTISPIKLTTKSNPPKEKPKENEVIIDDSIENIQPTEWIETDYFETETLPQNEKIILASGKKEKSYSVDVITIVISSAVILVVLTGFVAIVYKCYGQRFNYKNYGSRRSDSLTDVVFLTSDETLDFTLQRCED